MLLIFLGAPGSGKGTISERMVENHGYKHISTGDIFRKIISEKTELGKKVKETVASGNLVDDKTTWEIAKTALDEIDLKKENVILDGFPRNVEQAKMLEKYMKKNKLNSTKPIYFEVSEQIIVERLSSRIVCKDCNKTYNKINFPPKVKGKCDDCKGKIYQREDDKIENIKARLENFKKVTEPMIKYYADLGTLILVDGERSSEKTTEITLKFSENNKN